MAKKIVTLYIDDTSLRLMVIDGNRIEEWAELPLEPGLIQNAVVMSEAEVAAKIKQLFEAQKVETNKVIVGVSGFRCLTRPITLPELPKAMLDEAVTREAERALPVPLEELYPSWQTVPAPEGKTQVFLAAVPRKTADALLKALHQAGLKPSFMYLKPLFLARVAKEATAVIVDVQTSEFDIIIMSDGVPQPIRTVHFADEVLSWQEKVTMIRNELDRTITFYNSNNPENVLASSVSIFTSGYLANEPELCQSLSDELGHPVLPLPSPLECPEGLDLSRYMVNIGLALQELSLVKEAGASVVSLNALPASYQPKPPSLTNILVPSSAAIAAGLLVLLIVLNQIVGADIASIRTQLSKTDQLLQRKQLQSQKLKGDIAKLNSEITEVEASRDNLAAAVGGLEKEGAGLSRDLEVTIESLPNSISLDSISHANSILTIRGRALNEKQVLLYLRRLDTSGRFGEITITNMTRSGGGMIDFTLLGSLQAPTTGVSGIEVALSNLPITISLTSVTSTDGTLNIKGRSPDEDEVLRYLKDLEASGRFHEVTITSMTRSEDGGMNFSIILKTGE